MSADCIFCKIVRGEIPSTKVVETDRAFAFRDLNPQASTHVLVVPKEHIADADHLDNDNGELLAGLFSAAREVALSEGLSPNAGGNGYRLVMNVGEDAGNTVPHLHLHVLGGRSMGWPPG